MLYPEILQVVDADVERVFSGLDASFILTNRATLNEFFQPLVEISVMADTGICFFAQLKEHSWLGLWTLSFITPPL